VSQFFVIIEQQRRKMKVNKIFGLLILIFLSEVSGARQLTDQPHQVCPP
jgi:hypothetical protein